MQNISPKIRDSETVAGRMVFWCPGCNEEHQVNVSPESDGPSWHWNGSYTSPTFGPSIRVTTDYTKGPDGEEIRKDRICHSYISSGFIDYCADSTHALAGQSVELPEYQYA